MRKKVSLLLFSLSCVVHGITADHGKKLFKRVDHVVQTALMNKSCGSGGCGQTAAFGLNNQNSVACTPGKRGPRGKRGHRGTSATGLNELFINAAMMTWFGQAVFQPEAPVAPYIDPTYTDMLTWTLYPSTEFIGNPPVGANFNIPIDLDVTQPVTAVIHVLVDSSVETGNQAKLQVQADYQPNNGLLGSVAPATGFADTENSADFTVISATPSLSDNFVHMAISIPLDTTKMAVGDWAFITVGRITPAANEYSGILFLSTISIQYSLISS